MNFDAPTGDSITRYSGADYAPDMREPVKSLTAPRWAQVVIPKRSKERFYTVLVDAAVATEVQKTGLPPVTPSTVADT